MVESTWMQVSPEHCGNKPRTDRWKWNKDGSFSAEVRPEEGWNTMETLSIQGNVCGDKSYCSVISACTLVCTGTSVLQLLEWTLQAEEGQREKRCMHERLCWSTKFVTPLSLFLSSCQTSEKIKINKARKQTVFLEVTLSAKPSLNHS